MWFFQFVALCWCVHGVGLGCVMWVAEEIRVKIFGSRNVSGFPMGNLIDLEMQRSRTRHSKDLLGNPIHFEIQIFGSRNGSGFLIVLLSDEF